MRQSSSTIIITLLTQSKLIWTKLKLIFDRVDCKHIQLLKSPTSFQCTLVFFCDQFTCQQLFTKQLIPTGSLKKPTTTFPQMIQDRTQSITQNKSTMNFITWPVFLGVLQSSKRFQFLLIDDQFWWLQNTVTHMYFQGEALNCYSCPRGGLDCQNG